MKSCIVVQTREKGGRIFGPGGRYVTSSKKSHPCSKQFSQKVAAKNPEEKHQKMDSGSTKTEIQVDESKDVKPPAFGHDMTKMEKRRKNTRQQTHHHGKNRAMI
jgi:hypothetical protein